MSEDLSESSETTSVLNRPADEFVNDPTIETIWLSQAVSHMETYFKLITSLPSLKSLKLTKNDDFIYDSFRQQFNDLNVESLKEEDLKSEEAKAKWRQFCNGMEAFVEDFNFATLLRLNSRSDYSESNTILVVRAQFLAVEIARNREGLNDGLNQIFADK